jgi:hypothetical protein
LKYISWFYYANEALIVNQWADVNNLPCDGIDANLPCYHNGDEVLALVDFDKVKQKRLNLNKNIDLSCFLV